MNIYNLFLPFWQESERNPFTITEAALYHYLLYEANRNRWVMPFRCSTVLICHCLSTTKQNIQKAREALKERGFIDYKVGIGKRKPAEYTILQMSGQLSLQVSQQMSEQSSHQMSEPLTSQLPLYYLKGKDINKDREENKNRPPNLQENGLLPISSLQEKLQTDVKWKSSIISLLQNKGKQIELPDLSDQLDLFFQTLTVSGVVSKSVADCRSHFFNWVCKQLDNQIISNHDRSSSQRRGVDVPSTQEQNYEGAF